MQDYHLVCAQPEVTSNFHRLHNGDEKAHVGKWAPVNFDDAPDLTKRRTVLYTSQLNIPTWLRKILGAQDLRSLGRHTSKAGTLHADWCSVLIHPF